MKLFIAIFLLTISASMPAKASTATICNTNDHCRLTWVCIGGTAANGNANYTGKCKPNMAMRQMCYVYKIVSGKFGRIVVLIAISSLAIGFFAGKIEWKMLFATVLGTVFIIGGSQVLSFIIRDNRALCDFSNTL
jgi:type IV secretory pathway VirB2 component (pilin)